MRSMVLAGLVLCASLAACTREPAPQQQANNITAIQSLQIGTTPHRCIKTGDSNLSTGGTSDVTGDIRAKLLTPEAMAAGVRVYVSGSDVNNFGSVVIHYATSDDSCLLWSETIPLQEYSQRLKLNPVGLSPYYEATPATPAVTEKLSPDVKPPYTKADLDKQVGQFKLRDLLRSDAIERIEKGE